MLNDQPTLLHETRTAFRLTNLEIYNWGPFSGLHKAQIDLGGTAIIGMTGSGKTTLIDAYVTLLTERPKYNLASTGGHESDRDLMSYVRGVVGSGNESGDSAHISRRGKTTTGLCATYTDGSETIRLGAILWIDGNSFAAGDLKRAWIFSRNNEQSLEHWLSLHHEGGLRRLKRALHDSSDGGRVFDTSNGGKSRFLSEVRDFFEVSANAFALLNRAAGLKQLNSIDEIFRELVLEDHSQFDRAAEVVADFDRLTEIHDELLTAQRQQSALRPVESKHKAHLKCRADLKHNQQLLHVLPRWIAQNGTRLWQQRTELNAAQLTKCERAYETIEAQRKTVESEKDNAYQTYLKTGGSNINDLKERIKVENRELNRLKDNRSQYQTLCAQFDLSEPEDRAAFETNQKRIGALSAENQTNETTAREHANKLGAEFAQLDAQHTQLNEELKNAKAHTSSNLPQKFLRFRDDLATALNSSVDSFPFVAELLEVKENEADWRGAIERALGGNRTRILIPDTHIKAALRWIHTHKQHQIHIRLLEADMRLSSPAPFMQDGFTRKLNFKEHPLREALKHFLASHDLHCISDPEQLTTTQHALTQTGLTSGKRGYYEKKDQIALDQEWYTGFDNRDRVRMLIQQQAEIQQLHAQSKATYASALKSADRIRDQITILEQLAKLKFEEIDSASKQHTIKGLEARLRELEDPNSDAGKAYEAYEQAKMKLEQIGKLRDDALGAKTKAEQTLESAQKRHEDYKIQLGDGLTANEAALSREHLPLPENLKAEGLERFKEQQRETIDKRLEACRDRSTKLQNALIDAMNHAQNADTGALAEAGTTLEDIPAYLERLRVLNEEALPKKRGKFISYLNQSSDQGVTQLLTLIKGEVDRIRERIDELNRSLHRVDFREGRYLRLDVQDVTHESLRTLERALKHLRAAYAQREQDRERHFKALQDVITLVREAAEKKHTRAARALLDPRHRVEFHGTEVDRATDEVVNKFKGSQSGSGGEKEIIASYILTASLCYALSPGEGQPPLHSTIILDEAFSKSSRAVARRIIGTLREFMLHPIFVTPDKEMRLLRDHTRSVINVHRRGSASTLTSIRWEELEARIDAVRENAAHEDT